MNKIVEILKDLEFDEREIKIYLALLKLSDSPALKISKETGIDRTTTYDLLERLIRRGIISFYIKNKAKHFSALSPEKLLFYFKEKYSSLESILPELKKISNQNPEVVKCELFYGKEGLKSVGRDIVNNAEEYRVIGIRKEYEEILGYFNEQAILKLDEFKAKEIAIVEKNAKFIKLKNGEYKHLDKKLLSPVTTLIYKNKVIFFIWKEPYFAVSIENNQLAKAQTEYFNILWKISK
ncbi:MAG: helix-turn-helix domain-containing protein [archaeon]|nr:helix-turn-helix domain-containing protein [archaeon]